MWWNAGAIFSLVWPMEGGTCKLSTKPIFLATSALKAERPNKEASSVHSAHRTVGPVSICIYTYIYIGGWVLPLLVMKLLYFAGDYLNPASLSLPTPHTHSWAWLLLRCWSCDFMTFTHICTRPISPRVRAYKCAQHTQCSAVCMCVCVCVCVWVCVWVWSVCVCGCMCVFR